MVPLAMMIPPFAALSKPAGWAMEFLVEIIAGEGQLGYKYRLGGVVVALCGKRRNSPLLLL